MGYRTPEQKARRAARWRERYANDPEFRAHSQALNLANYHRNKDRWASAAQEVRAARSANAQARKYGVPGVITAADVSALWDEQPTCLSCGKGRGLDHIVPMARGGSNTPDNLQNLCVVCNQAKHAWDLRPEEIERPPFDGDERVCRRGHARAENTYVYPGSGKRICMACHKQAKARYYARKAAAA